jgi:signal transduction histidine kinase
MDRSHGAPVPTVEKAVPGDPSPAGHAPSASGEISPAGGLAGAALVALDAATVAIAQEVALERILQVIVDRVRPLVGARYAALGIPDDAGRMERFITSGISDEQRLAIGHPPRGHGLLGVIIREGEPVRVADIAKDRRSAGFPPNHPPMRSLLGVPVRVEGRAIGNLYLTEKEGGGTFTAEDEALVETFARHAGLAIHNARLHQELQHLAVLRERERIGQDLHDGIIQSLYAVSLSLEDMEELIETDPGDAGLRVERAIEAIHGAIRDIRSFILGLRPEALEGGDLATGLAALIEEFRHSTLVDAELEARIAVAPGPDVTLQLVQLAREALSNVARHAGASLVNVRLTDDDDVLRLSIADNGRGFDLSEGRRPGHHGLNNMRARAESLGGRLTLQSDMASGTSVIFELPLGGLDGSEEYVNGSEENLS